MSALQKSSFSCYKGSEEMCCMLVNKTTTVTAFPVTVCSWDVDLGRPLQARVISTFSTLHVCHFHKRILFFKLVYKFHKMSVTSAAQSNALRARITPKSRSGRTLVKVRASSRVDKFSKSDIIVS